MSDNAASFIGDIPEHYDRGLGPLIFSDCAAEMAQRVAALSPSRVLETAAGTGIVTRRLRDLLPEATSLTATDLNPPMMAVARSKFRADEAVEFQVADATALPYPAGSFDTVVCQFGVMFFPDREQSFREVRRVLVPGGHYLLSVWDAHRYNPFGRIVHEVTSHFFPTDPPQFYRVPFGCHEIDPIKQSLLDAGFLDIKVEVLRLERMIPDAGAFGRALIYGNPLVEQIRQRGGVDPDEVAAAVAEALRREFGKDPGRMPLQAIMFQARLPAA